MEKTKLVIFDRDGTLNTQPVNGDWVRSKHELKIIKGTKSQLQRLVNAGYVILVFTNQSCIGRGLCDLRSILEVNERLMRELPMIEDVYMCPHAPEQNCDCRKPKPGMLLEIIKRYNPDLEYSYIIGNDIKDIEAAKNAGMLYIQIQTDAGIQTAVDSIIKR